MEQQIIKGNTQLIAIIGDPVNHSISPIIHNHLFRKLDLPFVYIPLSVQKNDLDIALHALRSCNFAGANVTIPYKSTVVSYCDTISELSQLTGTVNTLYFDNGLLCGTTTDAEGFLSTLDSINHDITHGHVVILGNGGTARTLGFALAKEGKINTLTIVGRDQSKVDTLASEITEKTEFPVTAALFETKECQESLKACTLLVNCTSVGMSPDIDTSPLPQKIFQSTMTVFDVIYNPAETLFLQYAKKAGCHTQNGLLMLLYQGLASFQYWTGVKPDIELFDIEELQNIIL